MNDLAQTDPETIRRETVKKERRIVQNRTARSRYDAKTKRVKATLTVAEYAQLERQAKRAGQTPTAYLKQLAFLQMQKQEQYLPSAEVTAHLSKLIALLRNVANNINQIARHVNRHGLDLESGTLGVPIKYFINVLRPLLPRIEDEVKAFVADPPKQKNHDSQIA